MHELSLASTMVEQIEELMRSHGITQVEKVTVVIGALSGVDCDAFEFAFPIAVENTLLEGAALSIVFQPVEVTCRDCANRTSPDPLYLRCQTCGSDAVDVVSGRDLTIQSLEYTASTAITLCKTDSGLTCN